MSVIYTRALLLNDVLTAVTTQDATTNIQIIANRAVRQILADVDLRSSKRRVAMTPNLFDEVYDYAAPASLKGNKVIDIQQQTTGRSKLSDWILTTEQEFDLRKTENDGLICIVDADMSKRIRVSLDVDNDYIVVDEINAVGDWLLFGDGENLTTDTDNFVANSGSINWDISSAGGTTAGIYNASITTFDISDYKTTGSAYVWAYISSATNLTNFFLRVGSSSSAYYYITITTTNEGLAFTAGWNLLRFDFVNKSTTGTPDDDACDYVALYMTKDGAKISETDYRFNNLIIGNGSHYNLIYYSRYLWQSNAAVYLENSTASTDYLNVETDEYDLIILKTSELTERNAGNFEQADRLQAQYEKQMMKYKQNYPSESLTASVSYYNSTY
jgi:hypothetical protein